MQFPNMDEEDGDFSLGAAARSRLSSLFQSESSSGDVNQALTFTAPKQPRKTDSTQSGPGALKLIHAVVVHAYKLKDGNYANQGKLGCAILGQHETASYKLLLYKGKQVPVVFCYITPSFTFHVQPNNYANFYDEKQENWSLNFDSEQVLIDFAKQIALAKANSQGKSMTSLVVQDLANGEGPILEQNDSAEIKYTGWLLTNFAFGQVFDSNMTSESCFRLRLGKSKIIKGWNEGLHGAQKGSKRLLVIPPNLAYGAEGMATAVPPNSTLIFEIHVMKVKISRDSSHSPSPIKVSESVPEKKPEVPPRHSFSQEDNIRMRGASISEQLSQSPKKDKAHLISRMAKMGTATLPLQGAIPAQVSSDSETEEVPQEAHPTVPPPSTGSRTSSPKAFSKPRSRKNSESSSAPQSMLPQAIQASIPFQMNQQSSQLPLYAQATMPTQSPYMNPAATFPTFQSQVGQFTMPQSQFPLHSVSNMVPSIATSVADAHLPLLITETRSQNSEVRLSLSKITDKVETVIQKIDDLRLQGRPTNSSPMSYMEGSILAQNIERIVQENQKLKDDIEVKNSKIQSLNEKICDLFQRNQRFFEESSSILEQRSDSMQAASAQSQARLISLEQEKARLASELSNMNAKLSTIEADLLKHKRNESELHEKLLETEREAKRQENLLNDTKEDLNEKETLLNSLQDELKHSEQEKQIQDMKMQNLQEKYNVLKETEETLEKLLEENKRKHQEYKSKIENEISEMKNTHKNELLQYQEKLKQRTSSLAEMNTSGDKLDSETVNLKKELEQLLKEKDEVESKNHDILRKLDVFEKSESSYKEKISEMQTEVENALAWKKKYEVFYEKTRALKERYENQIIELMTEVKQLQAVKPTSSHDFSSEIKKAMNILYKLLQGKFDTNASYSGSKVLEVTLQSIRGLTLQMLEMKRKSPPDSTEHESDSRKLSNSSSSEMKSAASEALTENKLLNTGASCSIQQNGFVEEKATTEHTEPDTSECLGSSDSELINKESSELMEDKNCSKVEAENKFERKSEENKLEQRDCNETKVPNNLDVGNKSDEVNSAIFHKEEKPDEKAKRMSPDILKPEPPLFDDDDDEDDDDDWFK